MYDASDLVTATITLEFYKGAGVIHAKDGIGWIPAMVELTHRNTRRYGGYIIHLAIVGMFIGFSGAAFNKDVTAEVNAGDSFKIGSYDLKVADIKEGQNDNYVWQHASIEVRKGGTLLGMLEPERRHYKSSGQGTSEVAIRRRLNEDLYVNFAGMGTNNQKPVIQAYVFPLVTWIWIGFWILVAGTLICLVPSKVKMQFARTELVGVAGKHATVQK